MREFSAPRHVSFIWAHSLKGATCTAADLEFLGSMVMMAGAAIHCWQGSWYLDCLVTLRRCAVATQSHGPCNERPNPENAVAEVSRVLRLDVVAHAVPLIALPDRPGGVFVLTTFMPRGPLRACRARKGLASELNVSVHALNLCVRRL